jgi:hypothetical protein
MTKAKMLLFGKFYFTTEVSDLRSRSRKGNKKTQFVGGKKARTNKNSVRGVPQFARMPLLPFSLHHARTGWRGLCIWQPDGGRGEPARLSFCYPAPGSVVRGRTSCVRVLSVDTRVCTFPARADRRGKRAQREQPARRRWRERKKVSSAVCASRRLHTARGSLQASSRASRVPQTRAQHGRAATAMALNFRGEGCPCGTPALICGAPRAGSGASPAKL